MGLALNGFALLPGLRVAVPDLPYLEEITHREFPRLEIVPLPLGRSLDFFTGRMERVDGEVLLPNGGSYYTLLYPAFSVAVPHPLAIRFRLAYPVDRRDLEFARFLGICIDLQRKTGLSSSFMIIGSLVAMLNPSNPIGRLSETCCIGWIEDTGL